MLLYDLFNSQSNLSILEMLASVEVVAMDHEKQLQVIRISPEIEQPATQLHISSSTILPEPLPVSHTSRIS